MPKLASDGLQRHSWLLYLCGMKRFFLILAALGSSTSVAAQADLERGFVGALRGCEEWVINPASWAEGTGPFVEAVGLGDKMGLVKQVDEAALPPKALRAANHFWRINSTPSAGYILVVSDQVPMCHITGGGDTDLQPIVEGILASPEFAARWEKIDGSSKADMVSTTFRSREEPAFSILVSRASSSGQRLDRVQVIATATYDLGK